MNIQLFEKIQLTLPDGYEEVPAGEHAAYISSGKVSCLYAKKEAGSVFSANATETPLEDEQIPQRIAAYLQLFTRMVPGFVKGQLLQKTISGKKVAIMTYKSNAPDRDLFNLAALLSLDGMECQLNFVCNLADAADHMYSFLSVLESMTLCEECES